MNLIYSAGIYGYSPCKCTSKVITSYDYISMLHDDITNNMRSMLNINYILVKLRMVHLTVYTLVNLYVS